MPSYAAEWWFPADEPATNGHFPGNPIIPGAVLLRDVVRVLSGDAGTMCCEILSVKFLHPVRPGDRLTIVWQERTPGEFGFAGLTGSPPRRVIVGTLRMRTR